MPPKTSLTNDQFLAACIKHAKTKVEVNFDTLAPEIGMSKGGASNKYRAIIKGLEAEGAAWATDGNDAAAAAIAPAQVNTPRKRKAKAIDASESEASVKKPRAKKGAPAKAKVEDDPNDADESKIKDDADADIKGKGEGEGEDGNAADRKDEGTS
ncbi:uncharacterized protein HMPREF1541_04621 [Cyphellophora europaea CBS 101466]|uniref:Myb-like DNA-binding domain-containing protein n=1 Tax=Cyphellophora europaea (strain CBS 101466) TaxID=1220924 RepID=W2RXB7_CYPE1|nr:uncharacterized protein HMPREF1541_04621 [Cyphellophora europaea CBS 101466]ETN40344.1 hypothetical protein HMPREF1541_04621 [Cyphellophora europaea CBS 101466]